jgi:hypothetical protein
MKKKNDLDFSPVLHEQIHDIVEKQIEENNPKETRKTLDRLINSGYDRHDAIHMIGTVVVEEIYQTMKFNETFNGDRFVKNLQKLK